MPGSYRCECPSLGGWSSDGQSCKDTDECQYPNVCDQQASCVITQVDLTAVVIWAGEDKGLILFVSTSMNVRKRLPSNIYFFVMLTFAVELPDNSVS